MSDRNPGLAESSRLLFDQVSDKWSILVLSALCGSGGTARFNQIRRGLPAVPQKSLSQSLRSLERSGLINRRVLATKPVGVEYSITDLGRSLKEPFQAIERWAEAHGPQILEAHSRYDAQTWGEDRPAVGARIVPMRKSNVG